MKALNIFGATALVASTLTLVAAPEAKADTVFARNGAFTFNGAWKFDFNSSHGGFKSSFGIGPATNPVNSAAVIETGTGIPGSCSSCSMNYNFGSSGIAQFFYDSPLGNPPRMYSGVDPSYAQSQPTLGNSNGFLILTYANYVADSAIPGTYLSTSTDPAPYPNKLSTVAAAYFADPANRNGVVIGVNDQAITDSDYQDMILTGNKAVPVPALVPGLALAAAFLGYRSKRQAAKSTKA